MRAPPALLVSHRHSHLYSQSSPLLARRTAQQQAKKFKKFKKLMDQYIRNAKGGTSEREGDYSPGEKEKKLNGNVRQ